MSSLITLTTDFEERDPHVAFLKGVLCSRCPGTQIIDLSHEIPRKNVMEAAMFIAGAVPYFPKGTIHIVCVAAGAAPIAMQINDQYVLCPNNGVASLLMDQHPIQEVRTITNPDLDLSNKGQTFFGRDIFAPTGAFLASGSSFAEVGPVLDNIAHLNYSKPQREGSSSIKGQIIHIDHFGNLLTNIHASFVDGLKVSRVEVTGFPINGLSNGYADVEAGSPLAMFGSAGLLEIAYNGDRVDSRLHARVGNTVELTVSPA